MNSFYQKFLKKSNRSAPPPAANDGGTASQKNFLHIYYFARARFFLLKGKENFSASASAPKARGGGSGVYPPAGGLRLAGKNFLPPTPSIFARSPKCVAEHLIFTNLIFYTCANIQPSKICSLPDTRFYADDMKYHKHHIFLLRLNRELFLFLQLSFYLP